MRIQRRHLLRGVAAAFLLSCERRVVHCFTAKMLGIFTS